ncbi:MAG: tRNA (adenosine(37)-N6)-threonylcarbamoyltransferase complex ATPase subunit type 1 TsaE [Gammaproteobacteria bacterium]|jgi:tRNA threonylcarbamoyladenosine biosynthesis protein TsaE|nr:tRNA (adenosine(37)-N6)-threonylcarbamoyltransferase complex ATPase subunit type 1 TsaE [Gammaproteobacteria bacterium]
MLRVRSAAEMEALGGRLARVLKQGGVIHLHGDLGAGKTTLVRGLLRALGHEGSVRSPTYTLLETYTPHGLKVHHLDLYRLTDAEELEYIGLRDLLEPDAICLIEWPGKGAGYLPEPDMELHIAIAASDARDVRARARGERGAAMLADPDLSGLAGA